MKTLKFPNEHVIKDVELWNKVFNVQTKTSLIFSNLIGGFQCGKNNTEHLARHGETQW